MGKDIKDSESIYSRKIGEFIASRLLRLEMLLLSIVVIGLMIFSLSSNQNLIVLDIGLFLFGLLYFFRGFAPLDTYAILGLDNFLKYVGAWGLSISIIGILFRISNLPGWNIMLADGLFVLLLFSGFGFYWSNKHEKMKSIHMPFILRGLIIVSLGLLLYFTPTKKLEEIGLVKKLSALESIK